MKVPRRITIGVMSLCCGFVAIAGYCQSTVVELPNRADRVSRPATLSEFESPVTNSIDPAVLAFEQVLSNATWGQVVGPAADEITVQSLLEKIENLGLPVILDESSDLKLETSVEFRSSAAIEKMRLDSALAIFVSTHASEFRVTPDALIIASEDEMAENMDRVVYNVSALVPKAADGPDDALTVPLIQLIQNTVEPQSWEEDGPSLRPILRNGQSLLVIVTTYRIHREIRRLFKDVDALSIAHFDAINVQPSEIRNPPRQNRATLDGGQFSPSP